MKLAGQKRGWWWWWVGGESASQLVCVCVCVSVLRLGHMQACNHTHTHTLLHHWELTNRLPQCEFISWTSRSSPASATLSILYIALAAVSSTLTASALPLLLPHQHLIFATSAMNTNTATDGLPLSSIQHLSLCCLLYHFYSFFLQFHFGLTKCLFMLIQRKQQWALLIALMLDLLKSYNV